MRKSSKLGEVQLLLRENLISHLVQHRHAETLNLIQSVPSLKLAPGFRSGIRRSTIWLTVTVTPVILLTIPSRLLLLDRPRSPSSTNAKKSLQPVKLSLLALDLQVSPTTFAPFYVISPYSTTKTMNQIMMTIIANSKNQKRPS